MEKNKQKKSLFLIILFAAILVLIYISVFAIPDSSSKFSLNPEKIHEEGEGWRFLTYPFAHLNLDHLIKNLIALAFVALLITELKTKFSDFSLTYILAGFLAIIPIWIALQFTVLGASVAIYSALGLICIEASKINKKALYFTFGLIAVLLIESLMLFVGGRSLSFIINQTSSHFSGLIFGMVFVGYLGKLKILIGKRKNFCLRSEK